MFIISIRQIVYGTSVSFAVAASDMSGINNLQELEVKLLYTALVTLA